MVKFSADIRKYGSNGEKTGWTYVQIPARIAERLHPGEKRSFRIKGRLDKLAIKALALIPIGGGDFVLPLNMEMRKALGKGQGDKLTLEIALDGNPDPVPMPDDLLQCLEDEPRAIKAFMALPGSHRKYYIKWINSAKTEPTRVKRIAATVTAMERGMSYAELLRSLRDDKQYLI
jgi:hypothetical protein